jgi:hypothetical protein
MGVRCRWRGRDRAWQAQTKNPGVANLRAEISSLEIGLDFVTKQRDECLQNPPINDADGDGEPDAVDACPDLRRRPNHTGPRELFEAVR